jgi:4-hydroxy-3-polyprenylbenzoate decarboxylase
VKFIVVVDQELSLSNLETVIWYVTGNVDPRRDCKIKEATDQYEVNHIFVDGTRKSYESDSFKRDWPNPVVSSKSTIEKIDQMWPLLGLGELITSPSLNFLPLMRGDGAISKI